MNVPRGSKVRIVCWECSTINTPCHSIHNCSYYTTSLILQISQDWFDPLVSKSASMSSVGQYFNSILLALTCSRIKWNLMLICFDLPWNCGFLAMHIADWLSSNIRVGSEEWFRKSELSSLIHTDSCAALDNAMYSASAVDKAIQDCFLLLQLTAVPPTLYLKYIARGRLVVVAVTTPVCVRVAN